MTLTLSPAKPPENVIRVEPVTKPIPLPRGLRAPKPHSPMHAIFHVYKVVEYKGRFYALAEGWESHTWGRAFYVYVYEKGGIGHFNDVPLANWRIAYDRDHQRPAEFYFGHGMPDFVPDLIPTIKGTRLLVTNHGEEGGPFPLESPSEA